MVERGTLPGQRTVSSTLEGIAAAAEEAGIKPPSVTVVGPVAARRERIAWLERRPLHGKQVVVTRARAQASELARRLDALGAEPIELPGDPDRAPHRLRRGPPRGREPPHLRARLPDQPQRRSNLLFEAMAAQGRDARALANASVAAIGAGTEAALAAYGVIADIVPERFVAEELVEELDKLELQGKPVLIARAAEAREVLPDALRKQGRRRSTSSPSTRPSPRSPIPTPSSAHATPTSSPSPRPPPSATSSTPAGDGIPEGRAGRSRSGPITSEAIREAGLSVDVEAERHDIDGLVDALLDAVVGSD